MNSFDYFRINGETISKFNDYPYGDLIKISCQNNNSIKLISQGVDGYVILKLNHIPSGVNKRIVVVLGKLIENGSYYIQNIATDLYLDLDYLTTSDIQVDQKSFVESSRQRWIFDYWDYGVYSIQNELTESYLSLTDDSEIIQSSEMLTGSLWCVSVSEMGNLVLQPYDTPGYAMAAPAVNSPIGTDMVHTLYSNDANYYNDEWLIEEENREHDVFFMGVVDRNIRGKLFEQSLGYLEDVEYTNNNFVKVGSIGSEFLASYMFYNFG